MAVFRYITARSPAPRLVSRQKSGGAFCRSMSGGILYALRRIRLPAAGSSQQTTKKRENHSTGFGHDGQAIDLNIPRQS